MRERAEGSANPASPGGAIATPARIALGIWLLAALFLLAIGWNQILEFRSYDPDDSLRLVQVRDLLGGQGWWDVSQHRINPAGGGGHMHWSRIVDAPIATLILLLEAVVGQAIAERAATSVVPLLLLLGTMLALASVLARSGNRWTVFAGLLMVPTAPALATQLTALRIDHHGWQIMLSVALLALALGDAGIRRGLWAGLTAATLLAISLEGLPMVALFAVMFGAVWAWTGGQENRARLIGFFAALGLGTFLLQWITRGPSGMLGHWCDALSAPYLAMLAMTAVSVPLAAVAADRAGLGRAGRFALLATVAAASVAVMASVEPLCLRGPFGALDPVVRDHWYAKIVEGQPLWRGEPAFIVHMLVPIIVGLIGTIVAWRAADDAIARRTWAIIAVALIGATLVGIAVARSSATAQAFALPGLAALAVAWWQKARSIRLAVPRIIASMAVMLFAPIVLGVVALGLVYHATAALGGSTDGLVPQAFADNSCFKQTDIRALGKQPEAIIFAPFDIGPNILRYSQHSVVATGHHRNNRIMAEVLTALRGTPAEAEARVRATGATLVVICPSDDEIAYHAESSPDSLAARLDAGQPVPWLDRVATAPGVKLRIWRIRPPTE